MPPSFKSKHPPPEPSPWITSAIIEETTGVGVDEHNCLDDLEILFAPLNQAAPSANDHGHGHTVGLARCARLRRLSLVDCGLVKLGCLQPIAHTLERLCVADQKLTSLKDLGALPQLRWLYVQQNSITRIEGLDECPRLRALWLFDNKIQRCEGLTELAELRELWLQNNAIKRLGGLEALTALRDLQVAGNPIADYRDLPRLARLPSLESVGFKDAHFGTCPIAEKDGYRDAVLGALRHVTSLDASEVTRQDRHRARDAHLENVLEFHEKVDALQREHRDDAAAIEARRRRSSAHARSLDGEMRLAFAELERLVDEGRVAVKAEHAKHRRARALAQRSLDAALAAALAEHAMACDAASVKMDRRERRDETALLALERRARGERRIALVIASLQYGGPRFAPTSQRGDAPKFLPPATVACQLLGEHSPDFRWLDARLRDAPTGDDPLCLLRAYRVAVVDEKLPEGKCWFYCGDVQCIEDALHRVNDDPLLLHASAAGAVSAFRSMPAAASSRSMTGNAVDLLESSEDESDDDTPEVLWDECAEDNEALHTTDAAGALALLLLCREVAATDAGDSSKQNLLMAAEASSRKVAGGEAYKSTDLLATPAGLTGVAVEHVLLAGRGLVARDQRALEADLHDEGAVGGPTDALLDALAARVRAEVEGHRQRVARDLEPAAVDALRAADADLADREEQLATTRARIQSERSAQETILRSFREP